MALVLSLSKGSIEVVVQKDAAITCSDEEYKQYTESFTKGAGDESLLKLNGEPTRFVLRKTLPYEADLAIKDMQMSIDKGGEPKMRSSFLVEEVRMAMIDIKNPSNAESPIEFKRDADNYASKEIVQMLSNAGCIMDLWLAHNNAKGGGADKLKKK